MQILLIFLGTLGGLYGILCWAIWQWQERLTFFPSRTIAHHPDEYGMAYEDVWLPIPHAKRDRLHGWWLPAATEPSAPVILLLHGNGYNVGSNLAQAQVFHRLGYPVLMVDYRGYGRSEGPFASETRVYEDAQVAFDYLRCDCGFDPQQIIVFGHSMGGAIAIELASRNPGIAAMIIQGSFTCLRDMIDYDGIYGWLPLKVIVRQYFDSIRKVPQLKMPLFFVHGDGDRRVPSWMSERLYAAATCNQKDLYILAGADHIHVPEMGGEAYVERVKGFLDRLAVRSV